jgi:hypothetical protein
MGGSSNVQQQQPASGKGPSQPQQGQQGQQTDVPQNVLNSYSQQQQTNVPQNVLNSYSQQQQPSYDQPQGYYGRQQFQQQAQPAQMYNQFQQQQGMQTAGGKGPQQGYGPQQGMPQQGPQQGYGPSPQNYGPSQGMFPQSQPKTNANFEGENSVPSSQYLGPRALPQEMAAYRAAEEAKGMQLGIAQGNPSMQQYMQAMPQQGQSAIPADVFARYNQANQGQPSPQQQGPGQLGGLPQQQQGMPIQNTGGLRGAELSRYIAEEGYRSVPRQQSSAQQGYQHIIQQPSGPSPTFNSIWEQLQNNQQRTGNALSGAPLTMGTWDDAYRSVPTQQPPAQLAQQTARSTALAAMSPKEQAMRTAKRGGAIGHYADGGDVVAPGMSLLMMERK